MSDPIPAQPRRSQSDAPPIQSSNARTAEELQMLMAGFATGLTIAAVFLVYIVLAYAQFLP